MIGRIDTPQHARVPDGAVTCQTDRPLREFCIMEECRGRAVSDDRPQFGITETPVEGHEDRAQPSTGELDFECVSCVLGQYSNPVAGGYFEFCLQMPCQPGYAVVELPVGKAPIGC